MELLNLLLKLLPSDDNFPRLPVSKHNVNFMLLVRSGDHISQGREQRGYETKVSNNTSVLLFIIQKYAVS